ncbi:MAG: hypothetical protein H7251_06030, partial [Acetobacteraceae bacterium]|nr:hypothetical protein [Acetobacteraceae bacterium]
MRRFAAILAGLTLLLWGRLNRAVRRFHHALTRAPGRARTGVRALRARGDDVRVRPMTLPPGRGWLVRE